MQTCQTAMQTFQVHIKLGDGLTTTCTEIDRYEHVCPVIDDIGAEGLLRLKNGMRGKGQAVKKT